MNNIKLSVVRLDGCYTRESPPKMGQRVYTFSSKAKDGLEVVALPFSFGFLGKELRLGHLFPTKELAEAAALSLSEGVALGDRLTSFSKPRIYTQGMRTDAETSRIGGYEDALKDLRAILGDADKGEG